MGTYQFTESVDPTMDSSKARKEFLRALGTNSISEAVESEQLEDEKALKMLELHESGQFTKEEHRIRLILTLWVIRSKLESAAKRGLDLCVSIVGLIFALPIMIITAIFIKLDSPGPIIFNQQRVGKWGKPFTCYKFRSMYVDAEERKAALMAQNEADGVVFKMKHDPRITRVGRYIRKFSIDELPQIFNVIKGDMSLVGPRPPVPIEVAQYEYDQYRRLNAIPGITGLQQISGRSELSFKRWVELDLEYIERQSLLKDLEILIKTIPAVIMAKGAY
jgi:exopolysaccharide biosynthesis polyprenyl glycosylphosphotransferase